MNSLISLPASVNQSQVRPESDYLELLRLGKKLGVPVPMVHITIEVVKDGVVVSSHRQRSHTWNRNFWNANLIVFAGVAGVVTNFGAGYISLKRTTAAVDAVPPLTFILNPAGIINNSVYGIQVGSGVGAESFDGFVLSTLIAHGTAAGQLSYAAASSLVQSYVAGTKTWTITLKRVFSNTSGGSVDVKETAITFIDAYNAKHYMLCRDLLNSTVPVPNNQTITVAYDITLAFPG